MLRSYAYRRDIEKDVAQKVGAFAPFPVVAVQKRFVNWRNAIRKQDEVRAAKYKLPPVYRDWPHVGEFLDLDDL